MKFSDISDKQWEELRPYLDTCLLPVTGMTGQEQPFEATAALERLRDVMDLVEIPFKGRVVTYPAMHYINEETRAATVNELCLSLKRTGFRYVIVASPAYVEGVLYSAADLVLCPNEAGDSLHAADVSRSIQSLWNPHVNE